MFLRGAYKGGIREVPLIKTEYTSQPIPIPASFLTPETHSGPAVTYSMIDFSQSVLPEYKDLYAVILDNVLTPAECNQLIALAEQSAGASRGGGDFDDDSKSNSSFANSTDDDCDVSNEKEKDQEDIPADGWTPALVNAGPQGEFLATDYRNSDRIIWDEKTIVARLWARCLLAPGLKEDLDVLEGKPQVLGKKATSLGHRWLCSRLNERMRYLRYGPGQFFREHCDGTYETPDRKERTFYTLHLYLNDDVHGPQTLQGGGATTFHSRMDRNRRIDVNPRAGRVLIFQHSGLLHSGDTVTMGTKYTMRTDLLFKRDAGSEGGEH